MKALVDGDTKLCSKCGKEKTLDEFHNCKGAPLDKAYWCKECANSNSRKHHSRRMRDDPEYRSAKRSAYIKHKHGMTVKEYEERLRQQGSRCAICEVKLQPDGNHTHYDHCHKTGQHRAFLCTNCNRGLGHFQDSITLLQRAADYLNEHSLDDD